MVRILRESTRPIAERKAKPRAHLLLIDDNQGLSKVLKAHLEKEGYAALSAADGESGLALARREKPDLIVLDLGMPKVDGLEFLKTLRQESKVPVLILSGRRGDVSQILGLKLGADDYMMKPFAVETLLARVEAILRRTAPAPEDEKGLKRLGSVTVDPERREVRAEGRIVALTIKEFDLLKALIEARGKVLSREALLKLVWAIDEDVEIRTRTVDQHIAGIRQKLGPEGERIVTVPHFGYRISLD